MVAPDGTSRAPGDPESGSDPTVRGLLHWAPLHHDGHAGRLAAVAAWIAHARPRAFVVDVSVEVTLLVRLLGVPPVVVAQPGDRSDAPHALGWDAADLPSCWLFASHGGGWRGHDVLVLEPCTGHPLSVADGAAAGTHQVLEAGATRSWSLTAAVGRPAPLR